MIASRIAGLDKKEIEREFLQAKKNNIAILDAQSPDYPQNLRFINDPPILFTLGAGYFRRLLGGSNRRFPPGFFIRLELRG